MSEITWYVQGAEVNQTYDNAQGVTTDLPYPYTTQFSQPVQSYELSFYWNETGGEHSVYAVVDDSQTTNTVDVDVEVPTVSNFTIDYNENEWGSIPGQNDGFRLDPPGMTYNATVTLPAGVSYSANFGFIQLTSWTAKQTNAVSGLHTFNTGGFVLDNSRDMLNPTDPGYLIWTSPTMNPGTPVSTSGLPYQVTDQPNIPYSEDSGTPIDQSLELSFTAYFSTTLVYQPDQEAQGLWTALYTTPTLEMTGTADYNATTQTWTTSNVSPAVGGTLVGAVNQAFVAWTGYYTAVQWSPPYN